MDPVHDLIKSRVNGIQQQPLFDVLLIHSLCKFVFYQGVKEIKDDFLVNR